MENAAPGTLKRIAQEVRTLVQGPPEGVKVTVDETDMSVVQATVVGPESTPYQGGVFHFRLVLSPEYPAVPPKAYFHTKIFHPNISKTGEVCVDTLKRGWNAELGLPHVLLVIRCLLIHPNPESALNEDAGKLLLEDYDHFARHARMMTEVHAVTPAAPASASASACSSVPASTAPADDDSAKKRSADTPSPARTVDRKKGLRRL